MTPRMQSFVLAPSTGRCFASRICRRHSSTASQSLNLSSDMSERAAATHVHSSLPSGLLDYTRGWAWQQAVLSRRLELRRKAESLNLVTDTDCVLLLEHSPVYTLGRGADEEHLLFLRDDVSGTRDRLSRKNRGKDSARLSVDRHMNSSLFHRPIVEAVDILADAAVPVIAPNGVPIYRVERGGEVTFHGPGQLVVYPLLDLRRQPYRQDLRWYLRTVEQVIMEVLRYYDIESCRDEDNTGVWVGDNKVAAVGVSSSRWITTHGFALNVNPDLRYFDTDCILPCGIEGKGVTSMMDILKARGSVYIPDIHEVAEVTIKTMEDVFGVPLRQSEDDFILS